MRSRYRKTTPGTLAHLARPIPGGRMACLARKLKAAIRWLASAPNPPDPHGLAPDRLLQIAIHEAGHVAAVVRMGLGHTLVSAALLPRAMGNYGVVTRFCSPHHLSVATRRDLEGMVIVKLAGRAAEELFFGSADLSVGSSSDLAGANEIVEDMLVRHGFGDVLGLVVMGRGAANTCPAVREEMKQVLARLYGEAQEIVASHAEEIGVLAERLLAERLVDGAVLCALFGRPSQA